MAFITSGSWVRGNFGAALREFLSSNVRMTSMVDFGEFQPFEDAEMIRPSITIIAKDAPSGDMRLFKWLTSGRPPETLSQEIAISPTVRSGRLGQSAWELETDTVLSLREKLATNGQALAKHPASPILMGIKPGTTDAFIVNSETRSRLIAEDPSCTDLFRHFRRGQDVRSWYIQESGLWTIALWSSDQREWPWTGQGNLAEQKFAETFPSVHRHMSKFEAQLKGRMDNIRFWWELRSCAYWDRFSSPKIVWPDITNRPRVTTDQSEDLIGDTAFFIPNADGYLLGILASWASWFFVSKTAQPLRLRSDRWQYRLKAQYMENLPIPAATESERQAVANLAERCCSLGSQRYVVEGKVQRRLVQVFGTGGGQLNQKAEGWWKHPLSPLGDALQQSFRLPANPMKNPHTADEWEPYLQEKVSDRARLSLALQDAENELNDRVFHLFDLNPAEITLLKKEVEH